MTLKVLTLVGTRPEIIKLSSVIKALDGSVNHILVHTGQNYDYELNQIFFDGLGLRPPDHFLGAAGVTAAETISKVIALSDAIFELEAPDALLLLGDTNSCLAAISAKRRKIPIFHMEAGNRCFDDRVPEEINRRIVDHISDINLPYTEHARRYLLAEGIRPETVIKTGSPMKQVIANQRESIRRSRALEEHGLSERQYVVVSIHREENVDDSDRFLDILKTLGAVHRRYQMPIIMSTHPRTRKRLESTGQSVIGVNFVKPLGFADYVRLEQDSHCVISDSGTLTEESSILGFAAVMLRDAHERPEGMDEGTLIMSPTDPDRVINAIDVVAKRRASAAKLPRIVPDYDVDDVAEKVVNIILSYTAYVNRTVWRK